MARKVRALLGPMINELFYNQYRRLRFSVDEIALSPSCTASVCPLVLALAHQYIVIPALHFRACISRCAIPLTSLLKRY